MSVGVCNANSSNQLPYYRAWLAAKLHGTMAYLARPDRLARREDLNVILPGVQRLVVATLPYWPTQAIDAQSDPSRGAISCYAWGNDYHDILSSKLDDLASFIRTKSGGQTVCYVDTGAILERDLGARAQLGFIGKNTMLIDPTYGSGFFLGVILTTATLALSSPAIELPDCGACTKCLVACPTDAFIAPFQIDATRCISYLTIELKGAIPKDLRPKLGNLIYGCDICQQVCPWNRFSSAHNSIFPEPTVDVAAPKLVDMLSLSDADFKRRFAGTPIIRLRRRGFLRNVAIALGNCGDQSALGPLHRALRRETDTLVVEHLAWAISWLSTR